MLVLLYQWIRFMVEGQKCDAPLNLWLGGALGMSRGPRSASPAALSA